MSKPESLTSRERRARAVADRPPLRRAGRGAMPGLGAQGSSAPHPPGDGERDGRMIGGVAAGIASFVGASPAGVRWLWLLSLPLSGGLTGLVYLLLWALLPAETS